MLVTIKDSTDKKFIGEVLEITLDEIPFSNGNTLKITGRCHLGKGLWRLWNSNYVIEVQEHNYV